MKAGKLAIQPWLICPYNENTLVDLLSSVGTPEHFSIPHNKLLLSFLRPKHLEFILGCTELQISVKLNLDVNINSYGREIHKHELKILRL